MPPLKIAVVIGSTRPGRKGETVARWVLEIAKEFREAEFELVDLAEQNLPFLDEPLPPSLGKYSHPHTQAWSEKIARCDGFVFVTPEYNHATSAVLKNALDYLFAEWGDKAAGMVGYGSVGGARAVENLRLVLGELKVADVRTSVLLFTFADFEKPGVLKPLPQRADQARRMLREVLEWSQALRTLRESRKPPAP